MAKCAICFEEYSIKRKMLGYRTCLKCGDKEVRIELAIKQSRVMPAFNKGGLQYIQNINSL